MLRSRYMTYALLAGSIVLGLVLASCLTGVTANDIPAQEDAIASPTSEQTMSNRVVHSDQWKEWIDEGSRDPAWKKFQEENPDYLVCETMIYRAGEPSVNKFYKSK